MPPSGPKDGSRTARISGPNPMIEFRTRSKQHALADLVAKLETLPENERDGSLST
jgi:hypothetical protein